MALKAQLLVLLEWKTRFFTLKVDSLLIDVRPRVFLHEHEEGERGAQAPLDLKWGKVALSFERRIISCLLSSSGEYQEVGTPSTYAHTTQKTNSIALRGSP